MMTTEQVRAIQAHGANPLDAGHRDAFGIVHFKDAAGRMRRAHPDGRVWDFDRKVWLRTVSV